MRVQEIEKHLREKLPVVYPSYSTDWAPITAAVVSSNLMTLTAANSYSVSDSVIITGLTYENSISSVALNLQFNRAIVNMAAVHEFTEEFQPDLTISGANEIEWNSTFKIISVPSRYQVEIEISPAITTEPTGTPVVEEINLPRYNSLFTVTNATTSTFEVATVNAPDGSLVVAAGAQTIALNNVNVSSDIDFERILDAYTRQKKDKVWIFVIAGATASSRSRDNKTDFDQSFQTGEDRIIHTQDNFSIFALYPTQQDVSAVEAQDAARNELRQALFSLLVGFVPSSLLTSKSDMIYYIADGVETYNASFYVHRYDFAVNVNITINDTYVGDSYAVRKIESEYINEETGNSIGTDKIDFTEVL